jgi:hypothetical protein
MGSDLILVGARLERDWSEIGVGLMRDWEKGRGYVDGVRPGLGAWKGGVEDRVSPQEGDLGE